MPMVDDQAAAPMPFRLDASVAVIGPGLPLARGIAPSWQMALQSSAVLVVALVDKLEWSSAHNKGRKARLV